MYAVGTFSEVSMDESTIAVYLGCDVVDVFTLVEVLAEFGAKVLRTAH